jgi:hypothetical protein
VDAVVLRNLGVGSRDKDRLDPRVLSFVFALGKAQRRLGLFITIVGAERLATANVPVLVRLR